MIISHPCRYKTRDFEDCITQTPFNISINKTRPNTAQAPP